MNKNTVSALRASTLKGSWDIMGLKDTLKGYYKGSIRDLQ